MDLLPRRLPWTLALAGAANGWLTACSREAYSASQRRPDDVAPVLLAVGFAAAFFVAGWIHVHRRSDRHGGLASASARILACCAAFGLIPGCIFGLETFSYVIEGVLGALLVGLIALPSALLIVHAHGMRPAPRAGSLLAGSDGAEDALAMVGAVLLLPWWRSSRPQETALILVFVALPAVAIGLHAAILAKQASLLMAAFPHVATSHSAAASIVCDIGFGNDQREAQAQPVNAYRSAFGRMIACRGDGQRGSRAALRLVCCSLVVCVAAGAQIMGSLARSG